MRFVFAVCLADAAPMPDKRRSRTREVPPQAEWRGGWLRGESNWIGSNRMICRSFPLVEHSSPEPRPWNWKKRVLAGGMMGVELMRRIVAEVVVEEFAAVVAVPSGGLCSGACSSTCWRACVSIR